MEKEPNMNICELGNPQRLHKIANLTWRRCNRASDWPRAIAKPSKILDTKTAYICFTENGVGDNPTSNFKTSFTS